jgi:hypothetical protein
MSVEHVLICLLKLPLTLIAALETALGDIYLHFAWQA